MLFFHPVVVQGADGCDCDPLSREGVSSFNPVTLQVDDGCDCNPLSREGVGVVDVDFPLVSRLVLFASAIDFGFLWRVHSSGPPPGSWQVHRGVWTQVCLR